MNKKIIFFCYRDKYYKSSFVIEEKFSFINFIKLLSYIIDILKTDTPAEEVVYQKVIFPGKRFHLINQFNDKILNLFLKFFFKKYHKHSILWIMEPSFYFLHNFTDWNILVFDFNNKQQLLKHNFYKNVFQKNLVFVYYVDKNRGVEKVRPYFKSKKNNLESKVFNFKDSLNKFYC